MLMGVVCFRIVELLLWIDELRDPHLENCSIVNRYTMSVLIPLVLTIQLVTSALNSSYLLPPWWWLFLALFVTILFSCYNDTCATIRRSADADSDDSSWFSWLQVRHLITTPAHILFCCSSHHSSSSTIIESCGGGRKTETDMTSITSIGGGGGDGIGSLLLLIAYMATQRPLDSTSSNWRWIVHAIPLIAAIFAAWLYVESLHTLVCCFSTLAAIASSLLPLIR